MTTEILKKYWYLILMALILAFAPSAKAETRVVLGPTGVIANFEQEITSTCVTSGTDGIENDIGVLASARAGLSDNFILEARYLFGINDVDNLIGVKTKYRTTNIVAGYRF